MRFLFHAGGFLLAYGAKRLNTFGRVPFFFYVVHFYLLF